MKKIIKLGLFLVLFLLLLVCVGCGEEKEVKDKNNDAVVATLYFPDEQGEWLCPVRSIVDKNDKYKAVINSLIQGTKQKGLISIFPKGTRVKSVIVQSGKVTVDLSKDIMVNFPGGSVIEEMMIGSIVNTLTEFPEIKKVKLLYDGDDTVILSNIDITDPFERMPELIKK